MSTNRRPIDANDLEAIARARPDDYFLNGSGVLKLIDGIRSLERQLGETRASDAGAVEKLTQAERDVLAERASQRLKWGDAHDDEEHHGNDLVEAAICYAQGYMTWRYGTAEQRWPWEMADWKSRDVRSNRVRAAAMLIADIDKRDRAALESTANPDTGKGGN